MGLTLKQVEERTGIGFSCVSEYETGKRAPRLAQLQTLAALYRRSISFFLDEGPIPAETVLWRLRPEAQIAGDIQGQFLRLCEQYHNLEVWCEDHLPCTLPKAEGRADRFSYRDAERLARQVRAELQLGDRPGQSLLWVLEEVCGVKVFHLTFEPAGSAACTVHDGFGTAILLNSNNVRWRRNFDLAHELFHVLTWRIFPRGGDHGGQIADDREEKLATCFAGNLLLPVEPARLAIDEAIKSGGKIAFADMFAIARQFDVSVEALCWRMAFLGYFKNEQAQEAIERYRTVADTWEPDRVRDGPPSRPARFRALAMKALRDGNISQGRFAEYMGISRREAVRYVEQEAPADEQVQAPPA